LTYLTYQRRSTINVIYELLFVQEDVFQSVGVPLVQNTLAGYNTSILSYGQVHIDAFLIFLVETCVYIYGNIKVNGYLPLHLYC
jgi:hypothetical protein